MENSNFQNIYNFGIREKLISAVVILIIVPIIMISFYLYSQTRSSIENRLLEHLTSIVYLKEAEIEKWLSFQLNELVLLADDTSLVDFLKSSHSSSYTNKHVLQDNYSKTHFRKLKNINDTYKFKSVTLLDLSGRIILSSNQESIGLVIKDKYVQNIKSKKEFVIEDMFISSGNELIMRFSSPIFDVSPDGQKTNTVVGIISLEIDPKETLLPIIYNWPGMGETGETFLVRRENNQIVFLNTLRHLQKEALKLTMPIDSLQATAAIFATDGDEGIVRALDYRGQAVIAIYRHIPFMDWGFVAKVDESEVFSELLTVKEEMILLTGLAILIISAIAFLFSIHIVKPILFLERSTKKIAEGDYSIDINLVRKDEIGSLARSLNAMSENIQQKEHYLEDANYHLKLLSEIDTLTMIANRRVYERRLNENIASALRTHSWLSLLMIDIDHFKEYNDNYGHDQGDGILKSVAKTISDTLPRDTDLVARFGGEEFVVLLPSTDSDGAFEVAESIRMNIKALAVKHEYSSVFNCITVSIGVTSASGKELSEVDLLKQADLALYDAKDSGKNCCKRSNT